MRVELISLEVRINTELKQFLLILLLLKWMVVLSSEILLISLLNLDVFIKLSDWYCGGCECFPIPLRQWLLIILEDLDSTRFGYLYDLRLMCSIFEHLLELTGQHFMINYDYYINFKLSDWFCQAFGRPIILWGEPINDTSACKCLRICWRYKSLKFFLIKIH